MVATWPNSKAHSAPMQQINPHTDHIIKDNPTEPEDSRTSPGDMNIPDP